MADPERSGPGAGSKQLMWIALPLLTYLVLLVRLWFDAPIQDDYSAILDGTMRLQDARSTAGWIHALVAQHNEHRIIVTRAAAWMMAELGGRIDFRLLALLGSLGLVAILAVLWTEFRDRVGAPLLGAAGFVLCQMTFYESALMSMAAVSNFGVLAFAMACFHFALRPGAANVASAVAFGLLAAGSQANGLFALPLAAAGAFFLLGKKQRGWLFAAVAVALWLLYMADYQHPANHRSPLEALRRPLETAQLFLVIVGGLAPGPWPATGFGATLVAALAWLALGGFWRRRPVIALCIAFILVSAAAAAVGRSGFGVFWASRYSINSSCLAAMVLLLIVEQRRWFADHAKRVFVAAAAGSLALSWAIWPYAATFSFRGHLLAKPLPDAPARVVEPYFGIDFPNVAMATNLLARAEARKLYRAPEVAVYAELRAAQSPAVTDRKSGMVDSLQVTGSRIVLTGWTDLVATTPGRTFVAHAAEMPRSSSLVLLARSDIALASRRPELVFSGFRWEGEYQSDEQARSAARALCLIVMAPGQPPTALQGNEACRPR